MRSFDFNTYIHILCSSFLCNWSHVGTNTSWAFTHSSHYFPSTHFTILLIHITVVHLHQESGHWKVTKQSCQHQWGTTILRVGWDMVNTGNSQQPVQMNWMLGWCTVGLHVCVQQLTVSCLLLYQCLFVEGVDTTRFYWMLSACIHVLLYVHAYTHMWVCFATQS